MPKHKHGGVVLKEGKEIAGCILAEHEVRTVPPFCARASSPATRELTPLCPQLFVGNLFFCIVMPWVSASSHPLRAARPVLLGEPG